MEEHFNNVFPEATGRPIIDYQKLQAALWPPPPIGVCQVRLMLTTHEYCRRQLLSGSNYCYWHSEGTEKYKSDAVESYFGPGIDLKMAIQKEVAEGRSLEGAYLVNA